MVRVNLKAVIIASLAGLLFGFDTAVISGVTTDLKHVFSLDAQGLGLAVSVALWGTFVGALSGGRLGDAIGGRDALRIIGALYILSSLGCALSPNLMSFVVFRFVLGLAVGASSVLAPVYMSEIVPAERRGQLVGLFQFNIVFGILLAYVSNFAVASLMSGDAVWRWKLGLAALPALLFFVLLYGIPQSALRQHGKPILFAILLAMFNQLSGINAILYYLNDIFAAAGFDRVSSDMQAMAVGAANLIATLIGVSFIDRIGRKRLLIIGGIGVTIALTGVAAIMATGQGQALLLWMLLLFIVSFAFSQGAVIWVYLSEIFPTPVRSRGQSLGSATHWIMNAIISAVFPVVAAQTKALPFVVFAICTLASVLIIARLFPETKGVELEAMEARIGH
ncbi:MAG: MFS transporter [Asticcacaulis sp.]|nr:MFS transporter [Asticcacaulis sp.]